MPRHRRCDHCDKLKHDVIDGHNYLGWPMKVCVECVQHQETSVTVTFWFMVIIIVLVGVWELYLSAQIEQARQLLCDSPWKTVVRCEAGEQGPGGFEIHPVPRPR